MVEKITDLQLSSYRSVPIIFCSGLSLSTKTCQSSVNCVVMVNGSLFGSKTNFLFVICFFFTMLSHFIVLLARYQMLYVMVLKVSLGLSTELYQRWLFY